MRIPCGIRLRTIADRSPHHPRRRNSRRLSINRIAFNGLVQDDYGFTSLRFVYRLKGADRASLALDRPSGREGTGLIHLWTSPKPALASATSRIGSRSGTMTG